MKKQLKDLVINLGIIGENQQQEANKHINQYHIQIQELKKNQKEYQEFYEFTKLNGLLVQFIYALDDKIDNECHILLPLIYISNFHIKQAVDKIFIKALNLSYDKYLKTMSSEELYHKLRNYLIKYIDQLSIHQLNSLSKIFKFNKISDKEQKEVIIQRIFSELQKVKKTKEIKEFQSIISLIINCQLWSEIKFIEIIQISKIVNAQKQLLKLIESNKQQSKEILQHLDPYLHKHDMKKIIQKHKFNQNQYPQLLEIMRKKQLGYVIKTFGHEKAEDIFTKTSDDLIVYLRFLEIKQMYSQLKSVFFRNKELLNDQQKNLFLKYQSFPYIKNPLIENNYFGPASKILNLQPEKNSFLFLEHIDVYENHFVDSKNFEEHIQQILQQKVLGLDCEFYDENCTEFNQQKLALLQIASNNKSWILDCIELKKNKEQDFKQFFKKMMSEENILKVGHSFKGDIKVFQDTYKTHLDKIENLLDIQYYFPQKSLNYITEQIFNKSMCKFEQTSNWALRPLRQTQFHYAILDAVVVLHVYLNKQKSEPILEKIPSITQEHIDDNKNKEQQKRIDQYLEEKKQSGELVKFVIDQMMQKLAKKLRHLGYDCLFQKNSNRTEILHLAQTEKRIILTKNKDLINAKSDAIIYFVQEKNIEKQIKEIMQIFSINLSKEYLMTRCVQCNNSSFLETDEQNVQQYFKKVDYEQPKEVYKFWVCTACDQVYWEGGQYKKARKQFEEYH